MSINPQEIAILLNLCPICPDIQYKILMLIIGMTGTPTSNLFKAPTIFTFYASRPWSVPRNKKQFNYSRTPLKPSAYFRDLVELANRKFYYYPSDEDEEYSDEEKEYSDDEQNIPNFSYEAHYETKIAYTLTYGDVGYIDYVIKLKEIVKNRLNKMIASEPIIETI
jgi:hypothetical protein